MRVRAGNPAFIFNGLNVIIDCNIANSTTFEWLYNGTPDQSRGNVSIITVSNANHHDRFTCITDKIRRDTFIIFVNKHFCV